MRLVVDVWVPGVPVTKGSVDVGRHGQVRQSARGYAAWSDAVRVAVLADMARRDRLVRRDELAMIRCSFWVHGSGAGHAMPWRIGDGDGDKLERCVWDGVTKAGAWVDDAQVVEWAGSRRYASASRAAGVHIAIWAITAEDIGRDLTPYTSSAEAYDRAMFGVRPA